MVKWLTPVVPSNVMNIRKNLSSGMEEYLEDVGDFIVKEVHHNLSGKVLNRRSGGLYNSIDRKVEHVGTLYKLAVYSEGIAYAAVHERGLRVSTRSGSSFKMPKRTYLWQVFIDKKNEIKGKLKAFLTKIMRG